MNNCPYRPLSDFMIEREGRFKPNDPEIASYKRLYKIDFSGQIHISGKPSKTNMIIIKPGDLVISGINVAKGALAIYEGTEPVVATIHYSSYIYDKEKIDIDFLKRFLKSPAFISELQDQVKGGIKTEIKPKHLLPLKARIPELTEQQKINQYFDATENEISDLSNEVNAQSSYITQLRQAILQEAIEGKLTADWRKEQEEVLAKDAKNAKVSLGELRALREKDPNYSAEALLEKIKAEKEKLVKEKKIRKPKPLAPIRPEKVPFELPEGWVWAKLDEIVYITRGSSPRPIVGYITYDPSGVNWIKIGDTKGVEKYITKTAQKITVLGSEKSQKVEVGDFILSNSMSYGKPYIMGIDGYIHDGWFLFKLLANTDVDFFYHLLMAEFVQNQFSEKANGAVVKNIRSEIVKETLLPIPPASEQQAIVDRVEKLLSMVDELEKQVSERKEQSEQLMQTVLREAFEGESLAKNAENTKEKN